MDASTHAERGHLPKELPPCFNSGSFAAAIPQLTSEIAQAGLERTAPTVMNLARAGSVRRRLSIPNPFSQAALASLCADHWGAISTHLKQSHISLTRPVPDREAQRAVVRRVTRRGPERTKRMNRSRFVLTSDVSECYPSIYTHSIEWALHGKETSKARLAVRPRPAPSIGAQLDSAVRAGQEGQTKGIPIGPDTSLILAEIVLCRVDLELQASHPDIDRRCLRFMDDIEFFGSTQSEAEDVLLSWQTALSRYELMVNPAKTFITEAPFAPENSWSVHLRQFRFNEESDKKTANDIDRFFTLAFGLSLEFPKSSVLGYAIRTAAGIPTGVEAWRTLHRLMYAATMADPSCLQIVARTLNESVMAGFKPEPKRLEETLNDLCDYHARRAHGSEVAWALWLLRQFDLPIGDDAAAAVSLMQDNCSLLLLLDLHRLGRAPNQLDLAAVLSRASVPDVTKSSDWLLGYQCAHQRLTDDQSVRADPKWAVLLDLGVSFFEPFSQSASGSWFKAQDAGPVARAAGASESKSENQSVEKEGEGSDTSNQLGLDLSGELGASWKQEGEREDADDQKDSSEVQSDEDLWATAGAEDIDEDEEAEKEVEPWELRELDPEEYE